MKKLGHQLQFISMIIRDGSGVKEVHPDYIDFMKDMRFTMHRLSITEKTYIAYHMNVFVVKIKEK